MTEERWRELAQRLESVARERPRAYRLRVAALAALGYGYLLGMLVVLLAATALVVLAALTGHALLIKLALPLGALALAVVRSLWIRLPAPTGLALSRENAQPLVAMLEELRKELGAPRAHRVLLDGDLNAGIVQVPRLGGLGGSGNYLVIGLPLLQALSPDEFRAVLAHELGHLSGNHGRFSAWIYRLRSSWTRLLDRLEETRRAGAGLFLAFFRWYAPYFNAYSFALARAQEYEADRMAAEAAGAPTAARALVRLELSARYLHGSYWPGLYGRARREPEPPADPFTPLAQLLPEAAGHAEASTWLEDALRRPTDAADTHPALSERLAALGQPASGRGARGARPAVRNRGRALPRPLRARVGPDA